MKRLHPEIPLEDKGTGSSKHSITGEVSTSSKATVGVKTEPIDLVEDGPLDRFTNKDPTTKVRAQKAVQQAIYECINDLGFPSSTVEKPVFHALLETVHQNAKLISNKDFEISNKLLSSIRLQLYNEFVQLIYQCSSAMFVHDMRNFVAKPPPLLHCAMMCGMVSIKMFWDCCLCLQIRAMGMYTVFPLV